MDAGAVEVGSTRGNEAILVCQGKECLREIALALAEATGRPPAEIEPFTTRPPLVPTPLKVFAGRR